MSALPDFLRAGGHIRDIALLGVALGALAVSLAWLAFAAWRHRRNLDAIPLHIHVAGTRGKSTITRLIAAGLRAEGKRVFAKSTGSAPRLISPDGTETPWPRRGPASIREQAAFIDEAARGRAEAIVLECMAIRPDMIWASEVFLARAHVLVIANARPDHFEELGEEPDAMARALMRAIPARGRLVIAREAASDVVLARAKELGCETTVVDTNGLEPDAANHALASAACVAAGVSTDRGAAAMASAAPDPGAYFARDFVIDNKPTRFVSAFACNDARSLARLWRPRAAKPVVLLNARRDRPLRTLAIARFFASLDSPPHVVVHGDPLALRLARRAGLDAERLATRDPAAALRALAARGEEIWGVGNFRGMGEALANATRKMEAACSRHL